MTDNDANLRALSYVASRIPALGALVVFIPTGQSPDPEVQETLDRIGVTRWFPLPEGHRVLVPYEGGPFNAEKFALEKGAWDHEHCKRCGATIEPMTICWVTETGPYIILCELCHTLITSPEEHGAA